MRINKHDTNGIKPLLGKGELGYDDYGVGGDAGRVYVGTGSENIPLAKKSEIDSHVNRIDNPHSVTKTQVGLGNVDNTSDVNKPISTATQTALNLKAPLVSPAFTGTPKIVNDNIASISTSVTDNAIARYDGTTGKLQDSGVVIDDSGNVGIGTNSPLTKLNVNGPVSIYGGNGATPNIHAGLAIDAIAGGNNSLYSWLDNSSIDLWAGITQKTGIHINGQTANGGSYVSINTGGSEKMKIDSSGNVLLTSGTGTIGYGAGAGGTVTQLTSKSTAVALNKPSGQINTHAEALAAGAVVYFQVNNSLVKNGDTVVITNNAYGLYAIRVGIVTEGSFYVYITNTNTISLSDLIPITFTIIKGATA